MGGVVRPFAGIPPIFRTVDYSDNRSYETESAYKWYKQPFPLSRKGFMINSMLYIRVGQFFVLRGILLSLSGDSIRVALEECGDAAEYRRVANGWVSESGETVEIEWQSAPQSEQSEMPIIPAAVERSIAHYCVI